ncbi:MAG: LysR family transcriptional regulator [Streptococcaceae bacterium]|jgi:LysR family transcriptional repressor of citA|nr:LysR family transcriptional regulator [Streptococcaceae bacterium]
MKFEWYHTFLTVAKYLNYRKASSQLYLSESTVYKHIKKLEDYLQCSLFIIEKKRIISLTKKGEKFLLFANEIIEKHEKGLEQFMLISSTTDTPFKIGVTEYVATFYINQFISDFLEPNFNFSIILIKQNEILKLLEKKEIDLAISRKIYSSDKLIIDEVFEGKIRFFSPINKEQIVSERDYFKKLPILYDNNTAFWERVKPTIKKTFPGASFTRIDTLNSIKELIRSGSGISYFNQHNYFLEDQATIKSAESSLFPELKSSLFLTTYSEFPESQQFKSLFHQFMNEKNLINNKKRGWDKTIF